MSLATLGEALSAQILDTSLGEGDGPMDEKERLELIALQFFSTLHVLHIVLGADEPRDEVVGGIMRSLQHSAYWTELRPRLQIRVNEYGAAISSEKDPMMAIGNIYSRAVKGAPDLFLGMRGVAYFNSFAIPMKQTLEECLGTDSSEASGSPVETEQPQHETTPTVIDEDELARSQLWSLGYMTQPGMGQDVLLLGKNQEKLAFAALQLSSGNWKVIDIEHRGCLTFGLKRQSVHANSPHIGFLKFLGIDFDPALSQDRSPQDPEAGPRESSSAAKLEELGYLVERFPRPGLETALALIKEDKRIAFAEPLPGGKWRAKKFGMERVALGDADAAFDTGPLAALLKLVG